jgi:hypothetical protein
MKRLLVLLILLLVLALLATLGEGCICILVPGTPA